MEKGFILITENEFLKILGETFLKGAHSYSTWQGQPDTCWSNVEEDKKELIQTISEKYCNQ